MARQLNIACVVADNGEVRERSFSPLPCRFDFEPSREQQAEASLRPVECITVEFGRNTIRLTFDPHRVSPIAICALMYYLHDKNVHRRAGLKFCLTTAPSRGIAGQIIEVFRTLSEAVNKLQFLTEEFNGGGRDRFNATALDPARARYHREFARLMACWRAYAGQFDATALMPILRYEFADRYCLFEFETSKQDFRIVEAGAGLRIPDPTFVAHAPGSPLSGMSDFRYVEWLKEIYLRVMATDEPDYSDVSAKIFWPISGIVERNYRRMLLPWRDADGRKLLLSANRPLKKPTGAEHVAARPQFRRTPRPSSCQGGDT